ncbi:MAG TPA: dTMP kinase [Solirubrobacteraceae bacterium]
MAGSLITIEGIDGAGKSTLAQSLLAALAQRGQQAELFREPGGTEVAERIRALVMDPSLQVAPRAEALLYAAARAQLVQEVLEPRLRAGATLVLDRFVDSSLAYQGAARGLGVEQVRLLNSFAVGALQPDRTLLLTLPPQLARERKRAAGATADRLEREEETFFAAVAAAYEQLAAQEPQRIRTIDGSQPPEQVLRDALAAIDDLLGRGDRAD